MTGSVGRYQVTGIYITEFKWGFLGVYGGIPVTCSHHVQIPRTEKFKGCNFCNWVANYVQWDLRIMDTLVTTVLSIVQRLCLLRR